MKKYELSNSWAYKKMCEYCKLQMEIDKEVKNKKTKEKIVNLQDFINTLKDVKKRDEVISWWETVTK